MKSVRLEATKYIWTAYATAMAFLFFSSFGGVGIGAGQVILGIVISIAVFLSTGTIWNWGSVRLENEYMQEAQTEKAKRNRSLDRLLDNMTDDELLDLRDELRRSRQGISDDGELLYQESRR